jgi:hypothetical protein
MIDRIFRRGSPDKPKRKRGEPPPIPVPEKTKRLPQEEILSTLYYSAHYDEAYPSWDTKDRSADGVGCTAKAQFIKRPDGSELCKVMYRDKKLTGEERGMIYEQIKQNMEKLECNFEVYFVDSDNIMYEPFPEPAADQDP